jgi:GntP family gluconate:H+ symporter
MPLALQSAALVAATVVIIAAPAGGRLHPFAAIVVAALGYGLIAGMGPVFAIRSLGEGLASGFGGTGLFVLAGAVTAHALAAQGGLSALAAAIQGRVRRRRLPAATAAAGLGLGIVASVEAAFVLLAPVVDELAQRADAGSARLRLLLALALSAGHALLPLAPGPLIALTILAADGWLVLVFGAFAAAAAGLAVLAFAALAGTLVPAESNGQEAAVPPPPGVAPVRSALPIAVPIVLLAISALGHLTWEPLGAGSRLLLLAAGAAPTILVAAVALSIWAAAGRRRRIVAERGLIADAMTEAAPLVFIVSAAGAFARMLQASELPDLAADALAVASFGTPLAAPVVLAFAVAAVVKTTQGSSLVAMISAAGIVEPFLAASGDATRALAVVAIGAGATVVSHANDGYFWVVIRSLGLTPWQGYRTLTLGTLVAGSSAFIVVLLLAAVAG